MKIISIDPGNERSAFVVLDGEKVIDHYTDQNADLLKRIPRLITEVGLSACICEMVACYGMAVGREVFETCVMVGRLMEAWSRHSPYPFHRITRPEVKLTLCGQVRAKDPNVRAKLIDLYGPGKEKAIGTKKKQGPLYGVKGDEWAALAVGVAWTQQVAAAARIGVRA